MYFRKRRKTLKEQVRNYYSEEARQKRKPMKVPFYILIDDTDGNVMTFHNQYYNHYANDKEFCKLAPRRMKYIETAIRFKNEVSEAEKKYKNIKIVRVTTTIKATLEAASQGLLKQNSIQEIFWEFN